MYDEAMEFLVDQLRFLGLNDKEVRVFTALSTFGQMNMTKVAKRAGLARTTVDAIVRRLVEQGLVEKKRVGGHYEYIVTPQKVADKLDWIEQRFRPGACPPHETEEQRPIKGKSDPPKDTGIVSEESKVVTVHRDMHALVGEMFDTHQGDRVMMLLAALVTPEKRIERLMSMLDHARQANIQLEIMTTTDVTKELTQYAERLATFFTSYDLRLNFLPRSFCIEATDLVAFHDLVLVVDHHDNLAEIVKEVRTVAVIHHLLRVAREAGWGMDMKMWLEGVLASQEGKKSTY